MILVVFFFRKMLEFYRMRSRGGAECRKGCQGIPINLHMLILFLRNMQRMQLRPKRHAPIPKRSHRVVSAISFPINPFILEETSGSPEEDVAIET